MTYEGDFHELQAMIINEDNDHTSLYTVTRYLRKAINDVEL